MIRFVLCCGVMLVAVSLTAAAVNTGSSTVRPTIEDLPVPSEAAPAGLSHEEIAAASPRHIVYVGPEGGFLLHPGKSRGIFRWGQHWANSTSFAFADANYYIFRLNGTNGWFAFGKKQSGGKYVIWRGVGTSNKIEWLDRPYGWMRASRGSATGDLN